MSSRPEPVLTRAGIITVISVLSALLVKTGGGSVSSWLDANSDLVAGLILAAAPVITGVLARFHVAPISDPRVAAALTLPAVPAGLPPLVAPVAPVGG